MDKRFRSAFLALIFCLIPIRVGLCQDVAALRAGYGEAREELAHKRGELAGRYRAAESEQERRKLVEEARETVFSALTEKIFPAWTGTAWDYNGTSKTPGKGKIACGVFVVRTLRDAGFEIPERMARQPSEYIIKNLQSPVRIARFSNHAPMERVLARVREQGEGLYIVGLDIHVGFLLVEKGGVLFCHASYYDPPKAVEIIAANSPSPLTDSAYRAIGKILDDAMMEKWLAGEGFPLSFDYFKKRQGR